MWQLKTVALFSPPSPGQQWITRDSLAEQQTALDYLTAARAQADAIIEQAHLQAAEAHQQARGAIAARLEEESHLFWQQAEAILKDWQAERETQQQQLVALATTLLQQALDKCLDEVPEPKRLQALVRQFMTHHSADAQATIYCLPEQQNELKAWIASQPSLVWQVTPDNRMEPGTLRLVTANGELQISWSAFSQALCGQV